MEQYRVHCRIDGHYTQKDIECRAMTIEDGAYCFWRGEIGITNTRAWSFPVMFTIVENLTKD